MNYKSLLCAATLFAASGIAQAQTFPSFEINPENAAVKTQAEEISNINIVFSWDFARDYTLEVVNPNGSILMNEETGYEVNSTNTRMNDNVLIVNFDSEAVAKGGNGVWTLAIPEGTFTVSTTDETQAPEPMVNVPNPAITASYTLNMSNGGGSTEEPVVYPKIDFLGADPADGSKIAELGGNDVTKIKVSTSDDAAVNYIGWEVYDVTNPDAPEYIAQGSENRWDLNRNGNNDDIWVDGLYFTIGGEGHKLLVGHKYAVNLVFAGIGYDRDNNQYPSPLQISESTECSATVTYEGLTPAPEYSPVQYVSVSPNPEDYSITNPDLAFFHIEYSGLVKPETFYYNQGMGSQATAGTFEPFEGTEVVNGYASKWTFTFSRSLIESSTGTLSTGVITKDRDGLFVKGNANLIFDDNIYQMVWECNCGAPDLISVSPAENAEVESLSSITVSNEKDGTTYVMAYSYVPKDGAKAEIRTLDMETVRTLGEPVPSEDNLSATWTFEPITEAGTYILMIPAEYFAIGEEFDGASSNETSFRYYVVGQQVVGEVDYSFVPASITPEDGEDLESIETVTVVYGQEGIMSSWDEAFYAKLYKKSLVEDENGWYIETFEEVASASIVDDDYWNPTYGTYTFEPAITEVGEYKLVIPEGAFGDSEYFDSDMTSGIASRQIELYYTVSEPAPLEPAQYSVKAVSVTPKDGAVVSEISAVTVQFSEVVFPTQTVDGAEVIMPEAQLVRVEGTNEEIVESVPSDAGDNLLAPTTYTFNFTEVSEPGIYNVVIPRGIFGDNAFLDSKGETGIANEEITVMLIVSVPVGIDSVLGGEKTVNVYDINGVQLLKDADVEAVNELKSGLYIINGKKVMIRK